jgi:hypothetical protein
MLVSLLIEGSCQSADMPDAEAAAAAQDLDAKLFDCRPLRS